VIYGLMLAMLCLAISFTFILVAIKLIQKNAPLWAIYAVLFLALFITFVVIFLLHSAGYIEYTPTNCTGWSV